MKAYRYLTQYPIDASVLAFGHKQTASTKDQYQRYLQIEADKASWQLEAIKQEHIFLTSLGNTKSLRASYLAQAMLQTIKCMAASNNELTKLTPSTLRFWKVFTWRKCAPEAIENPSKLPLAGLIGSLASYAYCYPQENWNLTQPQIVEKLLSLFWTELNLNLQISPNERVESLLKSLNFDFSYIKSCAQGLKLLTKDNPNLKLSMIDESVVSALPARLLLGEVPDKFISEWARLQGRCNANEIELKKYSFQPYSYQLPFHLLQIGLTVCRGGGWALLMQAIHIEALLKIHYLFPDDAELTLEAFSKNDAYAETRYKIAELCALASDTQTFLSIFNTIEDAKTLAEEHWNSAKQWLDTTKLKELPIDSPNRLKIMEQAINYN